MPFTREKFLSLAPRNRAKKMADLLKALLPDSMRPSSPEKKRVLEQYNRMAEWLGRDALRDADDKHALLEKYIYWRGEAGMGPEEEVLRSLRAGDRLENAGEALDWEVLLHDLRSGHNAGSIVRTADAMGLRRIRLSGYTAGPDAASFQSAAMGAEQWMEILREADPLRAIQNARGEGRTVVALETSEKAIALGDFTWPEKGLLIPGNEELGVRADLLDAAHAIVTIPMYGRKASLNVANAFALAAWELRRAFQDKRTK